MFLNFQFKPKVPGACCETLKKRMRETPKKAHVRKTLKNACVKL
jgi:hypothetical protein